MLARTPLVAWSSTARERLINGQTCLRLWCRTDSTPAPAVGKPRHALAQEIPTIERTVALDESPPSQSSPGEEGLTGRRGLPQRPQVRLVPRHRSHDHPGLRPVAGMRDAVVSRK